MAEPDSRGPLPASRLVDTNVLIVASAVDVGSPFRPEGTPVDDAALRQRVFDWLEAFEQTPRATPCLTQLASQRMRAQAL